VLDVGGEWMSVVKPGIVVGSDSSSLVRVEIGSVYWWNDGGGIVSSPSVEGVVVVSSLVVEKRMEEVVKERW